MNVPLPSPAISRPRALTVTNTEHSNPLQIMGFAALQCFVFITCSRLSDLYLPSLHLPLIFSVIALLFTIVSGGLQRAVSTTPGKLLCAFTLWMILILPFSTWRGGSVMMLQEDWSRSFSCFLLVAGLTVTLANCRRIIFVLTAGSALAALIALIKNARIEGRLVLPIGLFSNSNDMAQMLLFALPLSLFFLGKGMVRSMFALGSFLILLMAVVQTGSRSALVAIAVMVVFGFFRASPAQRLLLVAGLAGGLIVVVLLLPKATLQRYGTIFGGGGDIEMVDSEEDVQMLKQNAMALESSRSRKRVLMMSLELTARNPIFGVGPGQFQAAAQDLSNERGERAMWLETHNTYTQVSSENGIPGLILYLALLITCFRAVIRLERTARGQKGQEEVAEMGRALLFALIGFAVTSFFSSIAYKFMFPLVFGLALALVRAGQQKLATAKPVEPSPVFTPSVPPARFVHGIRKQSSWQKPAGETR